MVSVCVCEDERVNECDCEDEREDELFVFR